MTQIAVSTSSEQSIFASLELSKNSWLLAIGRLFGGAAWLGRGRSQGSSRQKTGKADVGLADVGNQDQREHKRSTARVTRVAKKRERQDKLAKDRR